MNTKLFKDTLAIINKCFPKGKNITDDEFLYFLLGYRGTNSENDIFLLDLEDALGNCLTGKETLRSTLGDSYTNIQLQSQTLQIKDLVKVCPRINIMDIRDTEAHLSDMQDELYCLCNKYSISYTDSENSEQLFSRVFTTCITEKSPRLFASQKKKLPKVKTQMHILGRTDDSNNLLQYLEQYHKIIISGQHGSGKSCFIQHFLSTKDLPDYCYVTYNNDLETTKSSISFYKDKKQVLATSLDDLMNDSYSSSLLVIDHMNDSGNYTKELEELASYAVNIIVITTSDMKSDAFHTFRLSPLSDNTLLTIFKNTTNIGLTAEEGKLLFDISQKNVLLISLIAGQYKQLARQKPVQSEILHNLLSVFENTFTLHLPFDSSSTFDHSYDRKTVDILGHIKSIYAKFAAKYKRMEPLRRTMRFLCCFGYSVIPLSFLELLFKHNLQTIDTLSAMGWILKTDSTIQLPSLIARSVFAFEIPSFADCYDQINIMNNFLVNYDQTLSIPYLSNNLLAFAHSIDAKIKVKNNPKQLRASSEFETWQNLLYSIYNYYLENGNFRFAEKIAQMLRYPSDTSHVHSELDPFFFLLSAHMSLQDQITKIPEEVDNLTLIIENSMESLLSANTHALLITTMDNAIYLYCRCLFTYYNTDAEDKEKQKTYCTMLINNIRKILHDTPNPKLSKGARLSVPQYEYYQLCHTLMSSPKCIFPCLLEPFIQERSATSSDPNNLAFRLLAEANSNFRIRSIAFTMFMRSIYRKDIQIKLLSSACSMDSQMLISTVNSDIKKLHEQIVACEHIPWHTTWLCLYCYLQLIAELSALYQENRQPITMAHYSHNLKSLLHRSTFSKEILNEAYEKIATYFSL